MMLHALLVIATLAGCSKDKDNDKAAPPAPAPAPAQAPTSAPASTEVSAEERARAAGIVGELKKSLVGALQTALQQGAPAAVSACHGMAPGLAASLSRDGITVGRTTRKPRNPQNAATGWRVDALAEMEKLHAEGKIAGATFTRRLPDGRAAYAEPLVIQELCLTCHGASVAPEVTTILAEKYPADQATGYALGDLRGIAWVELPAR